MVLHIMQTGNERDKRVREAAFNFNNKKLAMCTKGYPEIEKFPVPIQKLLAQELHAVEGRLAEGKPVPTFEEHLTCHCR